MPEYAEMTAWSLEEVRSQLRQVLPAGWKVEQGTVDEYLWVRILDKDGEVAWDHIHMDEHLLLLDAFCWLHFRSQPKPKNSVWSERRGELTQRGVSRRAMNVPDPEDLDPDEIRSVYGLGREESNRRR